MVSLAIASLFVVRNVTAVSLDDIHFWAGTGTNRAALVVEWRAPEVFGSSTVPAPIANRSLVWGYRFNGSATGVELFKAVLAADPSLCAVIDTTYGTYVQGLSYRISGAGLSGMTSAGVTNLFQNRFLTNATVNVDNAAPVLPGDLFWSGYFGPNWEVWTEMGAAGGFTNAPERGTNTFWTATDPFFYSGYHGQWELAQVGLDGMTLTDGSWIGFTVAAGPYDFDLSAPYNAHKRAPAVPDAAFTALPVQNFVGQFSAPGVWECQAVTRTNWNYTLERSLNLANWTASAQTIAGTNGLMTFVDTNPVSAQTLYRLRAQRP